MKKTNTRRSECPIGFGLELYGDKWTLLIMRDILLFDRRHFREFAQREHIATNILAERLERLEVAQLITKQRDENLKNQFIYTATEKGWRLLPVILEMMFWGFQNDPNTPASKSYIARLKAEKDLLTHEATQAIVERRFPEYRKRVMGIDIA